MPEEVVGFVSVVEPADLHRVMVGFERAMDYGKRRGGDTGGET